MHEYGSDCCEEPGCFRSRRGLWRYCTEHILEKKGLTRLVDVFIDCVMSISPDARQRVLLDYPLGHDESRQLLEKRLMAVFLNGK